VKSPKENGCWELEFIDDPLEIEDDSADEDPQPLILDPNPIARNALNITEEPAALPIFSKNSLR
tara:strand:- start:1402 stop:1593 length:192 start_codon:yes stop_codon:yes gene_type:complete